MLEFLLGLSLGIFFGTYYDFKPTLKNINIVVHKYIKSK